MGDYYLISISRIYSVQVPSFGDDLEGLKIPSADTYLYDKGRKIGASVSFLTGKGLPWQKDIALMDENDIRSIEALLDGAPVSDFSGRMQMKNSYVYNNGFSCEQLGPEYDSVFDKLAEFHARSLEREASRKKLIENLAIFPWVEVS